MHVQVFTPIFNACKHTRSYFLALEACSSAGSETFSFQKHFHLHISFLHICISWKKGGKTKTTKNYKCPTSVTLLKIHRKPAKAIKLSSFSQVSEATFYYYCRSGSSSWKIHTHANCKHPQPKKKPTKNNTNCSWNTTIKSYPDVFHQGINYHNLCAKWCAKYEDRHAPWSRHCSLISYQTALILEEASSVICFSSSVFRLKNVSFANTLILVHFLYK